MLLYSEPDKPKLRNIAANPHVAVALRTDRFGSELTVITATAAVDRSVPRADANPDYIAKYRGEIARLGSDPETFGAAYSVPLRITPTRVRAT
jgi:PPOX class probable F420-dependent enzyme